MRRDEMNEYAVGLRDAIWSLQTICVPHFETLVLKIVAQRLFDRRHQSWPQLGRAFGDYEQNERTFASTYMFQGWKGREGKTG